MAYSSTTNTMNVVLAVVREVVVLRKPELLASGKLGGDGGKTYNNITDILHICRYQSRQRRTNMSKRNTTPKMGRDSNALHQKQRHIHVREKQQATPGRTSTCQG